MPSLTSVRVFDDSVPDFIARGLRQWQGRYPGKPQPKLPTWLSELHALGNYQVGTLNPQHRYSKRVVHWSLTMLTGPPQQSSVETSAIPESRRCMSRASAAAQGRKSAWAPCERSMSEPSQTSRDCQRKDGQWRREPKCRRACKNQLFFQEGSGRVNDANTSIH